ncbi:MAG: hypothetical protein PHH30_02525 [Bacteroidales bacterium]|nr:hypothetical protein [Bacteroidales bacterium]
MPYGQVAYGYDRFFTDVNALRASSLMVMIGFLLMFMPYGQS